MKVLFNIFGINFPRRYVLKKYGIKHVKGVSKLRKCYSTSRETVTYVVRVGIHSLKVYMIENQLVRVRLYNNDKRDYHGFETDRHIIDKWNELFDKKVSIDKLIDKI